MPFKNYVDLNIGAELNFRLVKGFNAIINFSYDAASPVDLTGATLSFVITKTFGGTALVTLTPTFVVSGTPANTSITIPLLAASTNLLTAGTSFTDESSLYFYSVRALKASVYNDQIMFGKILVMPSTS